MKKSISLLITLCLFLFPICNIANALADDVLESNSGITVTFNFNKTTVKAGESITCSWTVSGAKKPLTFVHATMYGWVDDGSLINLVDKSGDGNLSSLKCSSVRGNRISVSLSIYDADNKFITADSKMINVTGYTANPIKIKISFDKTTVEAGKSLTCSWTISGAKKPYQSLSATMYGWTDDGALLTLVSESGDVNLKSIKCSSVRGNRVTVSIWLRDADGRFITFDSNEVTVTGYSVEPIKVKFSFSKKAVKEGDPLTVSWKISGAVKPYQSLSVHIYGWTEDNELITLASQYGDVNLKSLTCASAKGLRIHAELWIRDADGRFDTFQSNDVLGYGGNGWLVLPAGLKQIDDEAFMNLSCKGIYIPDGCEIIGQRAFAGCKKLKYVYKPSSITSEASDAFEGCSQFTVFR